MPAEQREAALLGFGAALRHVHGREACSALVATHRSTLSAKDREYVERGMPNCLSAAVAGRPETSMARRAWSLSSELIR